jgi:triose/dihydroxyacetone kinase / FAD-AMP lyase (cyclizing)
MLSCAVLGNVFASPSVASIVAAIRVVAGPKGVLLIIKNYTGDRLNFGMAAEIAKKEGIQTKMVIVADDCALPMNKGITGGRGLAGTIFVHKIAGAAASMGLSLEEVHNRAMAATQRIGTLGVALSTCTVPGTPASTRLSQQPGLIEVGMGIHGEPGREQMVLPETGAADCIANILVSGILTRLALLRELAAPAASAPVPEPAAANKPVVVMLNNLGGLPVIEMQIVMRSVMLALRAGGYTPVRAYSGAFMTSLEMCGVSLSLFLLDQEAGTGSDWSCLFV